MLPRRSPSRSATSGREQGVALLTLLAVVVLGAALALVYMANLKPSELDREEITSKALAKAKEALIAYAVTYPDKHPGDVPGYLPCPDITSGAIDEGGEDGSCKARNVTAIGRLPWKSLGIEPLRDGSGECLWYAVSGTFKGSEKTELMNWDTPGQIKVYGPDGTTLLAHAAAVIFSPGVALNQNRQDDHKSHGTICSKDYAPEHFLDAVVLDEHTINNATPNEFPGVIAGDKSDTFNDRLLIVTPEEIFSAIEKRSDFVDKLASLSQKAAQCLTEYARKNKNYDAGDHRFPWAAPVKLTAARTEEGYWADPYPDDTKKMDQYWDDADKTMSGRFPYEVKTTQTEAAVENDLPSTLDGMSCPFRTPDDVNWWKNWKDHLFYAVEPSFKPFATIPSPTNPSEPVARVTFAGKRLDGKARSTASEKDTLSNYLPPATKDVHHCIALDGAGDPTVVAACP